MATSLFGTMKRAVKNSREPDEPVTVPKFANESGAGPKAMLAGAGWTRSFNMAPSVATVRCTSIAFILNGVCCSCLVLLKITRNKNISLHDSELC